MQNNTIEVTQGQNRTVTLVVRDQNGALLNLTGSAIYLTVREDIGGQIWIAKSTASGSQIAILDQVTHKGEANVYFAPVDTAALDPKNYLFDAWVVRSGESFPIVPVTVFQVNPRITVLS